MPSKSTVSTGSTPGGWTSARGLFRRLHRVLDGRDLVELDIVELAVGPALDPAQVDVLDDVAGLGIDRDGSARTLPSHALHGREQGLAIGLPAGPVERGA